MYFNKVFYDTTRQNEIIIHRHQKAVKGIRLCTSQHIKCALYII